MTDYNSDIHEGTEEGRLSGRTVQRLRDGRAERGARVRGGLGPARWQLPVRPRQGETGGLGLARTWWGGAQLPLPLEERPRGPVHGRPGIRWWCLYAG